MKKSHKNHDFKVNSILTWFCVVAGLLSLYQHWPHGTGVRDLESKRAESLAYQILQMQMKAHHASPSEASSRGPASVKTDATQVSATDPLWSEWQNHGAIGQDSFGRPYRFEVQKTSEGLVQSIRLWSSQDIEVYSLDVTSLSQTSTN